MWANPPASLVILRDMLTACPAFTGAGMTQASVHYPEFEAGDRPTADVLPVALLVPTQPSRQLIASGVSIQTGVIHIELWFGAATPGQEALAETLLQQLIELPTGLPINGNSCGISSAPMPGSVAAEIDNAADSSSTGHEAMRCITITINHGLKG